MNYLQEFIRLGMRDVRQINLLRIWKEASGNTVVPLFSNFDLDATRRFQDCISICEVKRDKQPIEIRILHHGEDFKKIYGDGLAGKRLGEKIATNVRDHTLEMYRKVVEIQAPLFSSWPIAKDDGPVIHYERLLLPFSFSGVHVDRIVCALALFSDEGRFSPSDISSGAFRELS